MRRGFILWIVLAVIALLGSTLIGIAQLARIELKHSQHVRARRQAASYARFATHLALQQIADTDSKPSALNVVDENGALNAHYGISGEAQNLLDPKTQHTVGRYKIQLVDASLANEHALGLLLDPNGNTKANFTHWLTQNTQWPTQLQHRNIASIDALCAFMHHEYEAPCTEPVAIGPVIRRLDWRIAAQKKSTETLTLTHTFTLYLHNPYPIVLQPTTYTCGVHTLMPNLPIATLLANTGAQADIDFRAMSAQKIQTAFNPGEHHTHTWTTTQTVHFSGTLQRATYNTDAPIVLYVADNERHFYSRQHVHLALQNSPQFNVTYDIGDEDPEHCNPRSTQIEPWPQHHFKNHSQMQTGPAAYNPWILFDLPKKSDNWHTLAALRHAPLCLNHEAPMYGIGSQFAPVALREYLYDHFYLHTPEHQMRTDLHPDVETPYVLQPFNVNNHHTSSWQNFLKQAFEKHPPERCPWSHARPRPIVSSACIALLAQRCAQTARAHGPFTSIAQFFTQLEPQWAPILKQNFGENLNFGDCLDSFCHRLTLHSDCIAANIEAETLDAKGRTSATCSLTAIFQRTYARDERGSFSWKLRQIIHH